MKLRGTASDPSPATQERGSQLGDKAPLSKEINITLREKEEDIYYSINLTIEYF